ncbi:hypothetical protein DRK59_16975 [Salmonella enterica subsp. diarizonae]|uniref:hypothetical protein n=1 Tax=Salmonella enterica TaxID=28901 RepID=UPI000FBA06EA|nr:hypothetical protein [Salmonella enterica]ECE0109888.1 hypothetical protein [Salmonella enterica subsp. diarizonae]EAQ6115102.1 hypothetical protein [Salmonella enterica]ECC6251118.1 hypothetical protein [Salmonella enterica]ECF6071322.1 hypothetical protein [Salmonella enterica subsp. diarizonae]
MKNFKILAVAAALSAVMTGSAFADAHYQSGQALPIATTFNSATANYAEVLSKHIEVMNGNVSADAVLAQVTNLPANSIIFDSQSTNASQLKFSDGSHSFNAIAYKSGDKSKVVSAGQNLPLVQNTYVTQPGDVIDISPVSDLISAVAGVYTSTPIVYTWVE